MIAAPVEVLHHVTVRRYVDARNVVLGTDVGDALYGKLIERVERQLFHFQLLTAAFHLVNHALDTPGTLSFVLVPLLGTVAVVDEQPLTQILPL